MTGVYSRKITFTGKDIGSRTLVLLLVFDFAKSNVQPPPSRQNQYPVVWKVLKFEKSGIPQDVTYTNRLAFTMAKRLKKVGNEERVILSPDPKPVKEVNASQETMLVPVPNKPEVYNFLEPIDLGYPSSIAMNGVEHVRTRDVETGKVEDHPVDIAFGFYETTKEQQSESNPAQIFCFHHIPQYTPVSLEFVPFLQAYFVPDGFYREGEVLTMPIPSPVALQVDIGSQEQADYSVSVVDNQAIIELVNSKEH